MDGAGEGYGPEAELQGYDPAANLRGSLTAKADDEGSTGIHPDRHQTHMMRVFTGQIGQPPESKQWLVCGAIGGGKQAVDDSWFEFYYQGIVEHNGFDVFGDWKIRVEGKNLEPVCQHIARCIRTIMKCGESRNSDLTTRIERIQILPHRFMVLQVNGDIAERTD